MTIRNLNHIFKPRRIAVIGASRTPGSVGYTVLGNLIGSGFDGVIYPVNPKHESVQGIAAYPNVASLPHTADLAIVCVPAAKVPDVVRECGAAGVLGVVIISAGFREVGAAGRDLEARLLNEARQFDGLRILGPNCLGFMVPALGLNASFAAGMPAPGPVAVVSQSGALLTSLLDWALEEGIGFSYFVSIGNMLDVDLGDTIDYIASDPQTQSLILYVESVSEAREFLSAARAFTRKKPIVAYKAGRFAASAKAAASHTGAMAGVDAVYEAAFERAGIVRVFDVDDLFNCAELLARQKLPRGSRLAIVTNAGGPGVMATDCLIAQRGDLATLAPQTIDGLNAILPPHWSQGNPVDVLGDASAERFARAAQRVLVDPGVDIVLAILTPQAMTDPTATAAALAEVAATTPKPLLTAWMGGRQVAEGVELLNRAGLATYSTPEKAVRAVMYLVAYARNLEILYETPRDVPLVFQPDRATVRRRFHEDALAGSEILSQTASKSLLEAYGIPVSKAVVAATVDEAVAQARHIGYPVVMKILSPQITHKTDVGGVALDLRGDDELRAAWDAMFKSAALARPDAQLQGVTIEPMVALGQGWEMIVGSVKDPVFGAVIMAGSGGIAAEVLQDRALGLPPLNERLARRMLESLKLWPVLRGYRGRRGVHLDRLVEVLIRFSYLVADFPEIKELDVNPLLVTPDDVRALDARVVLDREVLARPVRPFTHLAIRPYPEEYTRTATLKDGTRVLLRPIKPEDEPLWLAMIGRCSTETIQARFRYLFNRTVHELAARFCFIDYDRELAIVAEVGHDAARQLIGVGRLVADPDHEQAEYAVLVDDAWQGKGLGGWLTDYCLEIAASWGVQRVYAETMLDNTRMLATFRRRGFAFDRSLEPGGVLAVKQLSGNGDRAAAVAAAGSTVSR